MPQLPKMAASPGAVQKHLEYVSLKNKDLVNGFSPCFAQKIVGVPDLPFMTQAVSTTII